MSTALRTIRVYGPLAKLLKRRTFHAAVRSPQEAIRFLLANYPELEVYMRPRFFRVSVNGRGIKEEDICVPVGAHEDICITPAICGAGGPVDRIITGVGLIALSIFVPFVAPVFLPLGIGLTLTGVAQLISPVTPDRPESGDSRSQDSYSFNGLQQTSREGPPVPLVYGDIVTGSIVLSVDIERDDEKLETASFTADIASRPFVFEAGMLYQANLYATGCGLFTIPDPATPSGQRYYEEEWYIPASNQVCLWRWDSGNFDRGQLWQAIIQEPFAYKVQISNVINSNLETELVTEGIIQSASVAQYDSDGITLRGISFTHTGNYGPFLNQNNPPGSGNFNGYVSFKFFSR